MPASAAQRIIASQFDVLSFSGRVTNLLWDALAVARDDLLQAIESGEATTPFSATRQQIFLAQVDAALLRANEQYGRELEPALRATIIHEYETTTKALLAEAGQKLPDPFPVLPLERVQQLASKPIGGKTLQPWLDKHFKGLRTQLRREVAQSVLLGEDLRTAGKRLKHAFGLTRHGAETLAHTALLSTAHEARKEVYRENASLIKSYKYLATLDRRTCVICQPWDGQESETVGGLANLPQHPRCVPGDELVLVPNIEAGMRSWFEGAVVEIGFANGARISATGNHPFIGRDGFVRADSLREGDDLLGCDLAQSAFENPNYYRSPSSASEVFESLRKSPGVVSSRMPLSPEDLHGDGAFCDGQVDIVWTDRFLMNDIQAFGLEHFGKDHFEMAYAATIGLARTCAPNFALKRLRLSSGSFVRGRRQPGDFFGRGASHSLIHSAGPTATIYSPFTKTASDGRARNADSFGDGLLGLPGSVSSNNRGFVENQSFHEITSIKKTSYKGYVYTFTDNSGLFFQSNGIYSKNCRCVIIPVTSLSRVGTRPAVLKTKSRVVHHRDGTTSTIHVPTKVAHVSSTTTYEQFFKRQPAEWQRSVLGPERYKMWKEGKAEPEDFTRGPKDAREIIPLDELRAKLKREGK